MSKWLQIAIAGLTVVSIMAVGKKVMANFIIRNNNPGNIKLTNTPWVGKVSNSQNTDKVFEQFIDLKYGTRAMIITLKNYIKGGYNTIAKIIERYAPTSENPTDIYIQYVADKTGIKKTKTLIADKETLLKLVLTMSRFEHGRDVVSTELFNEAYSIL